MIRSVADLQDKHVINTSTEVHQQGLYTCFEVIKVNIRLAGSRCNDGSLITNIRNICTAEPWSKRGQSGGELGDIRVLQLDILQMHLEHFLAAVQVRLLHSHLTIKSTRSCQRTVQDVRTVSRGKYDNGLGVVKAVHFNQQLVQSAFSLIVGTSATLSYEEQQHQTRARKHN
jgi:hypothetical protein